MLIYFKAKIQEQNDEVTDSISLKYFKQEIKT